MTTTKSRRCQVAVLIVPALLAAGCRARATALSSPASGSATGTLAASATSGSAYAASSPPSAAPHASSRPASAKPSKARPSERAPYTPPPMTSALAAPPPASSAPAPQPPAPQPTKPAVPTVSATGTRALGCGAHTTSPGSATVATLMIVNRSRQAIRVEWVDFYGKDQNYADLPAGQQYPQSTYVGHVWLLQTTAGQCLTQVAVSGSSASLTITGG